MHEYLEKMQTLPALAEDPSVVPPAPDEPC